MVAAVAGSVISGAFASRNARKSREAAEAARRRFGSTGFSRFDTDTGQIEIDPTIRDQTLNQRLGLRSLIPGLNLATRGFQVGVQGIRESLAGLASDFEGNRSAFREAALNPAREQIARAEGETARELGRRQIFGTFGEQARAGVAARGATALADAGARVERDRINTLASFLGLDAELLSAGLQSEVGRVEALSGIEQILAGLTQDEFNREIAALTLASGQNPGSPGLEAAAANAEGVRQQTILSGIGEVLESFGNRPAPAGVGGFAPGTVPVPGASFTVTPGTERGFVGGF